MTVKQMMEDIQKEIADIQTGTLSGWRADAIFKVRKLQLTFIDEVLAAARKKSAGRRITGKHKA